jgi:hypothetical protein
MNPSEQGSASTSAWVRARSLDAMGEMCEREIYVELGYKMWPFHHLPPSYSSNNGKKRWKGQEDVGRNRRNWQLAARCGPRRLSSLRRPPPLASFLLGSARGHRIESCAIIGSAKTGKLLISRKLGHEDNCFFLQLQFIPRQYMIDLEFQFIPGRT